VVTLTRYSTHVLDTDNLQGAFKSIRDQVAAWLGCGDGADSPIRWRYRQAQMAGAKQRRSWFEIDIVSGSKAKRASKAPLDLEELQTLGEPPIRCVRKLVAGAPIGEVLARVPHLTGSNQPGSDLVVARKVYKGASYLSVAIYFSTIPHLRPDAPLVRPQNKPEVTRKGYRTLGVALYSQEELRAVRDACQLMLTELYPEADPQAEAAE
jgi:hypothetical protein